MNTDYIKKCILRLCNQPRTFEYISKNLAGLDPSGVLSSITLLEEEGELFAKDNMWVVREVSVNPLKLNEIDPHLYLRKYMGYFDFLKTPHPLDFEWRNSTSSLNFLLSKMLQLNNINDKILVLGMPTLLAMASEKDIPQCVTLVERNKPIIEGLRKYVTDAERFSVIDADIFKVAPKDIGKYHCVIMDPPWYSKHFYQFMWLASMCVEIGGIVGISIPPINTRPNIISERIDWLTYCMKLGLCVENLNSQQLEYAMPFFEYNASRAAGVPSMLPFWRKGDLALFRKIHNSSIDRTPLTETTDEWIERDINSVRIRIKISNDMLENDNDLKITSIVKADILPTVSTRDKRRDIANIWTSGNRIFETNDPVKFLRLLDSRDESVMSNDLQIVKDFLEMITTLEQKEFDNYLHWLYYEMERQTN